MNGGHFQCLRKLPFCIFLGLTILRGRECKFRKKRDFWQCAISRRNKIHLFLYARLNYYVMAFMSVCRRYMAEILPIRRKTLSNQSIMSVCLTVRLWASSCPAHNFSVNFLFSLIHVNECVINLWWSYEKGKWQEQLFNSKNELWQLANYYILSLWVMWSLLWNCHWSLVCLFERTLETVFTKSWNVKWRILLSFWRGTELSEISVNIHVCFSLWIVIKTMQLQT